MSGKKVLLSGERVAGAPYCQVTVRTYGGTPWQELSDALEPGTAAVFEKHTVLPAGFAAPRVDGESLRRRILINGAVWALEQAARDNDPGEMALLDRFGRYAALVPRLMQSCRALTVVTANTEEYHRLSERLFGMLGVAPMVTERADGLSGCRVVLAPEGVSGFGAVERPPLLFSPDPQEGLTVTADDVPSPFPEAMLARYDVFELLTAFRGERLFHEVGNLVPHSLTQGGRSVPMAEIAGRFGS